MKRIGGFRKEGGIFIGEISTLHLHVHARIVPAANRSFPNAPDYIILQSRTDGYAPELGAAWQRNTRENSIPYLDVEIDDPLCAHPIHAILCEGSNGLHYLYWDRHTTGEHIVETLYVQEEMKPQLGILRTPQNISDRFREIFPTLTD